MKREPPKDKPPKRKFVYDAKGREESIRRKIRQGTHLAAWKAARAVDRDAAEWRRERAEQRARGKRSD